MPALKLWVDADRDAQALFGLAPLERLRRSVGREVRIVESDAAGAPLGTRLRNALAAGDALLAVSSRDVIDPRLLTLLLRGGDACVARRGEGDGGVVLRLPPELSQQVPGDARTLADVAAALLAAGRITALDDAAVPAYVDKLRRTLPYWIHPVPDAAARRRVERTMFWDNYKGSTDVLTRHVYPPLVWPLTLLCTRLQVHPNVVTVLSIVLAFSAVPLFAHGTPASWVAGFVCAYAMSVLDSVDGKVARLTLTDSKLGNALDHGLDIVHPPFWYIAWAFGLGAHTLDEPLLRAAVWLVGFYAADRIVLGVARRRLGHALHSATPLDARVRGIIARRNVTMTIMAAALLVGAGPAGLVVVTAWQGLTFAWHAWRTWKLK